MDNYRWVMNRAGLVNFWYYDEEEFHFSDGKLLLRGSNGSGKSVTMQSFIPLLLDGNKSPERLDPFGSRARKLENYLLGEEETGKDESTGYIYLEFKKEKSQKYLTIGMGLNARRGKALSSWGFVITDGRRIGKDILLYKNMGEKIPLSKKEFKNRIADGGEVSESQREYMALVNKYLFGFDEIEDYDELIKLLIQLRTPKLSKDFKPTVIYEIMNNSLQPLSDDDLRPMSEAIENMDNIKSRLEELKMSHKATERIKNSYDQYNRYLIFEKAKNFIKSQDTLKKLIKDKEELQHKKDIYSTEHKNEEERIIDLEIQQKTLEEKKRELQKHDSYRIKEEISRIDSDLSELSKEKKQKEDTLNKKKEKERELYQEIKELENKESYQLKIINNKLDEMNELADDIKFDEHYYMKDELIKDAKKEYDFSYVNNQLNLYRDKIIKARKALSEEKIKNDEYDKALLELERSKEERDRSNKGLEETRLLFSETKEEFIEKMYSWEKENKELKISKDTKIEIARKVNMYGINITYDDIISDIRKEYNDIESFYNMKINKLFTQKGDYQEKLKEKEKLLIEWKNKKDPEPVREAKVILNRERLAKENIPFIPFYMAVDFQQDLTEEEKGRLEEALIDMGILDALIIPDKYKGKVFEMDKDMADKYLFASPKYLMHELSLKLKAEKSNVKGITEQDVENVLKSVLIDEQKEVTYLNEKGEFGIGLIRGKVSNTYIPKFIGASARKRFRDEMIQLILSEKEEIEKMILKIETEMDNINQKLNTLKEEYSLFPGKKDLETAYSQLRQAELYYENCLKEVEKKEQIAEKTYEVLQEIRKKVYSLTHNLELPANLEAFEEAEEDSNKYKEMLSELEKEHMTLLQYVNNKQAALLRKEDIDNDIDEYSYDLTKISRKIKLSEEKKKNLLNQLQISGFEEIQKEINKCIELLNKLPKEIKEASRKSERAKASFDQICERLKTLDEDIDFQMKLNEIYKEGFKEEYMLEYIFKKDDEEDLYKSAKRIYNELKYMEKQDKNKDDYIKNLQDKYHDNRQYMTEYSLKIEYIFVKSTENQDEQLSEAILNQKRLEIMGRVRGKYVNFYNLIDYIEEGILENEKLLRDSDRQLFEDILAKNISKKIRAKIYHSEEWVKKMNNLMESMNTSSGLSFSLSWRNKSAESEEQLDTKELVQLLRKDGNLLTENEINKLSSHFRSKISEARREAEEGSKTLTFHSLMKEVLDYRKWFEFRLFFKKTNENRKEMTNNAFDKFSGGEKAMAMYVPLFSAVYAKYEGARKDCPRIISLDEAFAGVDENNIRDMFRLLSELELNFIVNSQILWGDYDTVKSLSICELVRPNNANFVTVLRYNWNGKVKELITNEGEYYEQKEVAATMQ